MVDYGEVNLSVRVIKNAPVEFWGMKVQEPYLEFEPEDLGLPWTARIQWSGQGDPEEAAGEALHDYPHSVEMERGGTIFLRAIEWDLVEVRGNELVVKVWDVEVA